MPEQRVDLAITGLVMTEMEGIETILKFRQEWSIGSRHSSSDSGQGTYVHTGSGV
jgi:hypothetical protein